MARVPQAPLLALVLAAVGCGPRPAAQCGVASLVNVLARAGRPVGYADLLRETRVEQGHTTFADLARAAGANGVGMRGYRLQSADALGSGDIGVVELTADHFVTLVGREGEALRIVDSPDGATRPPELWSAARLEAEWTGNVLLVERR